MTPTKGSSALDRLRRRLAPTSWAATSGFVTAPSCVACAGAPLLAGPLAALGLTGVGTLLHYGLALFAPLNVAVIGLGYRRHRQPSALAMGVLGLGSLLVHGLTVHRHGQSIEVPDFFAVAGVSLIIGATIVDWLAHRSARSAFAFGCGTAEEYWRKLALGEHPGLRRGRRVLRLVPSSPRCALCNAPFAGIGAPLMRLAGKPPSAKNPRFCADCVAKAPPGGAEVEVSLLFVDVRGSTPLAEQLGPLAYAELINRFYVAATEVLVNTDALVIDFVGDEVVALYLPGFAGHQHARRAVDAARGLLRVTGHEASRPWIQIGIGVHTGTAYVGAVGTPGSVIDLRAMGDAVNTTARLTAQAEPGTAVISDAAASAALLDVASLEARRLTLKGKKAPVAAWVWPPRRRPQLPS